MTAGHTVVGRFVDGDLMISCTCQPDYRSLSGPPRPIDPADITPIWQAHLSGPLPVVAAADPASDTRRPARGRPRVTERRGDPSRQRTRRPEQHRHPGPVA